MPSRKVCAAMIAGVTAATAILAPPLQGQRTDSVERLPGGSGARITPSSAAMITRPAFSPPDGFRLLPGYFDRAQQEALIDAVFAAADAGAPFFQPTMPRTGQPLSVTMTNFGPLGWVTDRAKGYRYEKAHPETGQPWPAMPDALMSLWNEVANYPAPPEACLVNWYRADSRMGLHVDLDEEATDAAVVSVSLGDKARFRVGGPERKGPTASMVLSSGDVVVLGGAARRSYHGVDRIYPGTSTLVPGGGRINLTMRRVTIPG